MLWRPLGVLVHFVWVILPSRGRLVFRCTDLALHPLDIIRLYGWRFKIEVSFKQAVTPVHRGDGNQHMHGKPESYRQAVRRRLAAYERHIQLGPIAQNLLVYLAIRLRCVCWYCANHYLRTVKLYRSPSEPVVAQALRNTWSDSLAFSPLAVPLKKFLTPKRAPHYQGVSQVPDLEAAA